MIARKREKERERAIFTTLDSSLMPKKYAAVSARLNTNGLFDKTALKLASLTSSPRLIIFRLSAMLSKIKF